MDGVCDMLVWDEEQKVLVFPYNSKHSLFILKAKPTKHRKFQRFHLLLKPGSLLLFEPDSHES